MAALVNIDAGSVITGIGNAINKIFPNQVDRDHAQAVLDQIAQHPDDAQIELNKIEASSSSVFVAGWRPFIGWVCGVALAWNYVVLPAALGVLSALGHAIMVPPLDIGSLITLLLTMLGMSSLRTSEKFHGVAGNH